MCGFFGVISFKNKLSTEDIFDIKKGLMKSVIEVLMIKKFYLMMIFALVLIG